MRSTLFEKPTNDEQDAKTAISRAIVAETGKYKQLLSQVFQHIGEIDDLNVRSDSDLSSSLGLR